MFVNFAVIFFILFFTIQSLVKGLDTMDKEKVNPSTSFSMETPATVAYPALIGCAGVFTMANANQLEVLKCKVSTGTSNPLDDQDILTTAKVDCNAKITEFDASSLFDTDTFESAYNSCIKVDVGVSAPAASIDHRIEILFGQKVINVPPGLDPAGDGGAAYENVKLNGLTIWGVLPQGTDFTQLKDMGVMKSIVQPGVLQDKQQNKQQKERLLVHECCYCLPRTTCSMSW